MRLLGLFVAGTLLAVAAPQRSWGEDECLTTFSYATYDVEGDSIESLRRSMRDRGPVDEQGVRRYASTEWKVRWEWERNEKGDVYPDTVTLRCEVVITLPRVAEGLILNKEAEASWNELLEKIRAHELQHARHIQTSAPHIRQRIRARYERDGSISVEDANSIAKRVVQEARELDRRYDIDTEHGKSEGI